MVSKTSFADMISQIFVKILFLILFVCVRHISTTPECALRHIKCSEIRAAEGFRYKHECPARSEISVEGNDKISFGSADLRQQLFNYGPPVVKMDNHSVIMKDCQDVNITCTIFTKNHEKIVGEKCVKFKSNPEKFPPGNLSVSPEPPIQEQSRHRWIAALVILFVVFVLLSIIYYCWKKHKGGGIFNCLQRNKEGSGFPKVPEGDVEGQNNTDVRNGGDPRGSGENDPDTLQSAMSGNKGFPDTTTPSDHNPMNGFRNMNEDPGGINGTKGRGNKRELHGGGAAAHHHAEEQPLLPDQRTANGDFNIGTVTVTFVNELSSNHETVCRCSATPDADVESTYLEKPTNEL